MADVDSTPHAPTRLAPPRRRAHRKSRTGCKACKTSRVKCDETRPVCKNCHKRDAFCEYFDTSRARDRPAKHVEIMPMQRQASVKPGAIATTSSATESCSSLPLPLDEIFTARSLSPAERLFELRLLHHFLDMTNKATKAQVTWSFWILEQTTRCTSVMDAILGTSAYHLQRLSNFDSSLLLASHKYMARAIQVHKRNLDEGLNKSNSSGVAATCALVCMHANLSAYSLTGDSDQRQPHDWFVSSRRAMNLFTKVYLLIENPVIGPEFSTLHPVIPHKIHPNPFSFLLYWNHPSTPQHQEETNAYTTAVAHLSYIYTRLVTEKPLRFPFSVSDSFVDLVVAKNPRALAICGYFFMVVKLGRQIWWIDGAPEREFDMVMRCLPRDWWSVMDWAVRVFEWKDRRVVE